MERPSHSIKGLSLQTGSRRFAGAGLTVIAQFAFAATFIGGLVVQRTVMPPPDIRVTKVEEGQVRTPPPPIKFVKPVVPTAVDPIIEVAPESGAPTITTVPPQPVVITPPARQPPPVQPPPALPDRAAVAIAETHTAPPYPAMARRLGAQGKVTLRLSVQADGRVAAAEVLSSSGRQDLDQAAAQWITGHWTYRPAIRNGAPAATQVTAAVNFNLNDAQ